MGLEAGWKEQNLSGVQRGVIALLCDGLLCQFTHNWTFTHLQLASDVAGGDVHSCTTLPELVLKAASLTIVFLFDFSHIRYAHVAQELAVQTGSARLLSPRSLRWIFGLKTWCQCCCFNRLVFHRKLGRRCASSLEGVLCINQTSVKM